VYQSKYQATQRVRRKHQSTITPIISLIVHMAMGKVKILNEYV